MPAADPVDRHTVAKIASLSRSRQPDDPELTEARRELRARRLEAYIRRVVDEAPPLSDAQRAQLAAILHPAGGGRVA